METDKPEGDMQKSTPSRKNGEKGRREKPGEPLALQSMNIIAKQPRRARSIEVDIIAQVTEQDIVIADDSEGSTLSEHS